jgi:hypothetical protein
VSGLPFSSFITPLKFTMGGTPALLRLLIVGNHRRNTERAQNKAKETALCETYVSYFCWAISYRFGN